ERLELAPAANATGELLAVDDVAERRDPELDLEHARVVHVTGHGEQTGAGGGLGAELVPLVYAVRHDPRQVRQRLDVVDDGGLHVEALRRREERRLQARHAAVALERLDE